MCQIVEVTSLLGIHICSYLTQNLLAVMALCNIETQQGMYSSKFVISNQILAKQFLLQFNAVTMTDLFKG